MRYQRAEPPLKLNGLESARSFFASCLADSDPSRESLWVAHVDEQSRCLHLSRHDGDETGAAFPLRDIIADAASHGSAGIVLAHNHPSGGCGGSARLHDPRSPGLRREAMFELPATRAALA
jgi:DNA repair protein RadC